MWVEGMAAILAPFQGAALIILRLPGVALVYSLNPWLFSSTPPAWISTYGSAKTKRASLFPCPLVAAVTATYCFPSFPWYVIGIAVTL